MDWEIELYTVEDLAQLSQFPTATFKLMNDIDIGGAEWTPVGTEAVPFSGVLDGNSNKITNLTITQARATTGFFGYLTGEVRNLSLYAVEISTGAITVDSSIGAICGFAKNAVIENVVISGSISTASHSSDYTLVVAGACGLSESSHLNCITNNATVTSYDLAAGIIAQSNKTSITNCTNNAVITSLQSQAGGIIGNIVTINREDVSFAHLYNIGNVSAYSNCGGIIGGQLESMLTSIHLEYCCNYGNVISSDTNGLYVAAGGLIGGNIYDAEAIDCYNRGSVTGKNAGGIVGRATSATFKRCYSSGQISSTVSYAGGLGGWTDITTAQDCVVFGSISGGDLVSVVSGTERVTGATISNVYYNCTCKYNSGEKTNSTFEKSFYTNSLFWSEYNAEAGNGWRFSETDYPSIFENE